MRVRRQPVGRGRVVRHMSASATLAAVYSMPAPSAGETVVPDTRTYDRSRALDRFLAEIEVRAFRIAQIALRNEDDALDVVQDAMLRLARAYADRPPEEWKSLFYRILENRIRDVQRRRSVRSRVMAWLSGRQDDPEDEPEDPIAQAPSEEPSALKRLQLDEALGVLEEALRALPRRQQQAFLLRTLEGLDVAETARAMGCSEGSVKTHYFRAVQSLRARLGDTWP